MDRVLGGERDTTCTDDDHYEQIEVAKIHDEMTKTTQPDATTARKCILPPA